MGEVDKLAQDAKLGSEAATRYLPEGNLGTRTMTKAFENSLISGSSVKPGLLCVCTHWVLQPGAYFKMP